MALIKSIAEPYIVEISRIFEDASYSAQSYFEAAKSAEFWGRTIVFAPAVLGAISGLIVALGGAREWGAVGAVVGAVAATASFLGSDRKSGSFKESARRFTVLRHRAAMESRLALRRSSEDDLASILKSLRNDYEIVVGNSEPVPERSFKKAQKRIHAGVLTYESEANSNSS